MVHRLVMFNNLSLDGYFADQNGELGWAYAADDDAELNAFITENARSGHMLVLGRATYEMMAGYWPTPLAGEQNPAVAERMNALPKLVFSRTLEAAAWSNTRLVRDHPVAEMRRQKHEAGMDMTILGSGNIVAQLAQEGLIDEYQFLVRPVVLGRGRALFERLVQPLRLQLTRTRPFGNGTLWLCYTPAA